MPTGTYTRTLEHYLWRQRARKCNCGECKWCKKRAAAKRHYDRNNDRFAKIGVDTTGKTPPVVKEAREKVSDEELERRLEEKFKEKGWDRHP